MFEAKSRYKLLLTEHEFNCHAPDVPSVFLVLITDVFAYAFVLNDFVSRIVILNSCKYLSLVMYLQVSSKCWADLFTLSL